MNTDGKSIEQEQARYKRNYDARLRKPAYDIHVGSYVFLRKEQSTASERKHKLAQVATGPHRLKEVDADTVFLDRGKESERVSCDRVELAPSPMERHQYGDLRSALRSLSGGGASATTAQVIGSDPPPQELCRVTEQLAQDARPRRDLT